MHPVNRGAAPLWICHWHMQLCIRKLFNKVKVNHKLRLGDNLRAADNTTKLKRITHSACGQVPPSD